MHAIQHPELARQALWPRRTAAALMFMAIVIFPGTGALAHGVDYRIEYGDAVMIHFSGHHEGPIVGAGFRVFTPDGSQVFASGDTDALGRAVFAPDRPGTWRVLMATRDGHGAEVPVLIEDGMVGAAARRRPDSPESAGAGAGRIPSTAAGVGYLFGLAGLLALWRRRH